MPADVVTSTNQGFPGVAVVGVLSGCDIAPVAGPSDLQPAMQTAAVQSKIRPTAFNMMRFHSGDFRSTGQETHCFWIALLWSLKRKAKAPSRTLQAPPPRPPVIGWTIDYELTSGCAKR